MTDKDVIEDLRYRYISDSDAEYVAMEYPESRRQDWCPTCDGTDKHCDHELQRQLFKHYAAAGIPLTYQRIGWSDYFGADDIREFCKDYASKPKAYKENNIGLCLLGNNGIGKTTSVCLLLKDLVVGGHKCFFTTYSKLVSMLGDSFYDSEAKARYNRKILQSQFLGIDDVGKELSNRLTANAMDNVLRERVQASRPTFMTSNLSKGQLVESYGKSAFSLIVEGAQMFELDDDVDRRRKVRLSKFELAKQNIIKPIV